MDEEQEDKHLTSFILRSRCPEVGEQGRSRFPGREEL